MLAPHLSKMADSLIVRVPTLADVEAVVDLMTACSMKVVGEADDSVDEVRAQWQMPGFNLDTDMRLVLTPGGQVVGFAEVMDIWRPGYPIIDVYVHPDFEGDSIGPSLMEWSEQRARQAIAKVPDDARVAMRGGAFSQDVYYKALLESAGMQLIRHNWRMEIELDAPPPPPVWPEGITVRTFQAGEDARPVLRAQRDSFQDHWGYVETPFDEDYARWSHRWMSDESFDPSLWFLALDGDQIAGISLCKGSHASDPEMGWVGTLGVTRPYRRQGLGMALLLHSFGEFYRRGKKRAGLGVDASSLTGATRLYERAGMHVALQIDVYEKELRPGHDLGTEEVEE